MTDETVTPDAPRPPDETPPPGRARPTAPAAAEPTGPQRALSSAETRPRRPEYRGQELDPERGPGLGCFWFQVIVLGFFIVLIPIGLNLGWPYELLAILLFVVIGLLLLTGQSVIFLLRLVAADRRARGRRRPLASPSKTVGELEDEQRVAQEVGESPGTVARTEEPVETPVANDRQAVIRDRDATSTDAADEATSEPAAPPDAVARPEEPDSGVRQ
ncbi:MAG TPA: hypothetical protein VLM76_10430 [Patescibacteria group bacterium]|nr:hypothetical protein [Patescibacteria group bacterium]